MSVSRIKEFSLILNAVKYAYDFTVMEQLSAQYPNLEWMMRWNSSASNIRDHESAFSLSTPQIAALSYRLKDHGMRSVVQLEGTSLTYFLSDPLHAVSTWPCDRVQLDFTTSGTVTCSSDLQKVLSKLDEIYQPVTIVVPSYMRYWFESQYAYRSNGCPVGVTFVEDGIKGGSYIESMPIKGCGVGWRLQSYIMDDILAGLTTILNQLDIFGAIRPPFWFEVKGIVQTLSEGQNPHLRLDPMKIDELMSRIQRCMSMHEAKKTIPTHSSEPVLAGGPS